MGHAPQALYADSTDCPIYPDRRSHRIYARSVRGICLVTGNPFEFRYGKLKPWPNVPPFRLVLHSNRSLSPALRLIW